MRVDLSGFHRKVINAILLIMDLVKSGFSGRLVLSFKKGKLLYCIREIEDALDSPIGERYVRATGAHPPPG